MDESTEKVATEGPKEPEAKSGEWKQFAINMSFMVAGPPPVWVVRHKSGRYLRLTPNKPLMVPSCRMATRFDSKIWAMSWRGMLSDAKVVRLWTKTERETEKARKVGATAWTYEGAIKTEPKQPTQCTCVQPTAPLPDCPTHGTKPETK